MNPEPMAPIFDAILIGEGEEAVPHLVELCRAANDEGGMDEHDALLAEGGLYARHYEQFSLSASQ